MRAKSATPNVNQQHTNTYETHGENGKTNEGGRNRRNIRKTNDNASKEKRQKISEDLQPKENDIGDLTPLPAAGEKPETGNI